MKTKALHPQSHQHRYVNSPYFLGEFVGFETRLFSMITFWPEVSAPGWQILGRWGADGPATFTVPEPGTLAIVALALAAAGLAQRRH